MLDAQALFSDKQAITADAVSTNFINLGSPDTAPGAPSAHKRDLGGGNNIPLTILVEEAFATNTDLTVNVQMDDNSAFSSPKTVGTTGAIPVADLVVGKKLPLSIIPPGADQQYMRLQYVVGGSDATAGQITAGISTGLQTNG